MKVNAVEKDIEACHILKNNIDVFGLKDRINVYCDSYVD